MHKRNRELWGQKNETTQRGSWVVRNSDRKRVMLSMEEVGEPLQGSKCSK